MSEDAGTNKPRRRRRRSGGREGNKEGGGGEGRSNNKGKSRGGGRKRSGGGRDGGGNRDRRGGSGGGRGGKREDRWRNPAGRRKQPEPTFWEKILAFFGLGGKPKNLPPRKLPSQPPGASAKAKRMGDESEDDVENDAPPRERRERRQERREERPPKPAREPQLHEVTSGRLYVGNLSYDTTESDLFELFNGVGKVQNAEVVSHQRTMRSKGYAFVHMLTVDEAKRAVEELHDKPFMGRNLVVSGAKSEGPGSGGDSSKGGDAPEGDEAAEPEGDSEE